MGENKRKFLHWATFTRTFKRINACRLTTNLLQTLQDALRSNVLPLITSTREFDIKEKAIERIIANQMVSN